MQTWFFSFLDSFRLKSKIEKLKMSCDFSVSWSILIMTTQLMSLTLVLFWFIVKVMDLWNQEQKPRFPTSINNTVISRFHRFYLLSISIELDLVFVFDYFQANGFERRREKKHSKKPFTSRMREDGNSFSLPVLLISLSNPHWAWPWFCIFFFSGRSWSWRRPRKGKY